MLKENNNLYIMSDSEDLTKTLVYVATLFFVFVVLYNAYVYLAERVVMVEEPVIIVREGFDAAAFRSASGSQINQGLRAKNKSIASKKKAAKAKAQKDKKEGITTPAEQAALSQTSSSGGGSGGGGGGGSGGGGGGGGTVGGVSAGMGASAGSPHGGASHGEGFQGNQNCLSVAECQTMQTANDNAKLLSKLSQKVDQLSQNVSNIQASQMNSAKNKGMDSAKKASKSIPSSGLTKGIKTQSQNHLSKNS
ncbi:MAG: hypothetical protein ACXABD_00215 [Candidatus Thorarchaeota archaeon]|jgi:hypothetical protein